MSDPYERPRFLVRGYAGRFHPAVKSGQIPLGSLLVETTHTDASSKDVEVRAFQDRRVKGHVSRIVVVDREAQSREIVA